MVIINHNYNGAYKPTQNWGVPSCIHIDPKKNMLCYDSDGLLSSFCCRPRRPWWTNMAFNHEFMTMNSWPWIHDHEFMTIVKSRQSLHRSICGWVPLPFCSSWHLHSLSITKNHPNYHHPCCLCEDQIVNEFHAVKQTRFHNNVILKKQGFVNHNINHLNCLSVIQLNIVC